MTINASKDKQIATTTSHTKGAKVEENLNAPEVKTKQAAARIESKENGYPFDTNQKITTDFQTQEILKQNNESDCIRDQQIRHIINNLIQPMSSAQPNVMPLDENKKYKYIIFHVNNIHDFGFNYAQRKEFLSLQNKELIKAHTKGQESIFNILKELRGFLENEYLKFGKTPSKTIYIEQPGNNFETLNVEAHMNNLLQQKNETTEKLKKLSTQAGFLTLIEAVISQNILNQEYINKFKDIINKHECLSPYNEIIELCTKGEVNEAKFKASCAAKPLENLVNEEKKILHKIEFQESSYLQLTSQEAFFDTYVKAEVPGHKLKSMSNLITALKECKILPNNKLHIDTKTLREVEQYLKQDKFDLNMDIVLRDILLVGYHLESSYPQLAPITAQLDLEREQGSIKKIISHNNDPLGASLLGFGAGHDFAKAVTLWNEKHPNEAIALASFRPQIYNNSILSLING